MGVSGDSAGNVYTSDTYNHCIRRVDAAGSSLTLLAGACSQDGYVASSVPTSVKFYHQRGLWADSGGAVYVADSLNNRIGRVASLGTTTTVAGTGSSFYSPIPPPWASAAPLRATCSPPTSTAFGASPSFANNNQAGQSTTNGAIATQTNLNDIFSSYGDDFYVGHRQLLGQLVV